MWRDFATVPCYVCLLWFLDRQLDRIDLSLDVWQVKGWSRWGRSSLLLPLPVVVLPKRSCSEVWAGAASSVAIESRSSLLCLICSWDPTTASGRFGSCTMWASWTYLITAWLVQRPRSWMSCTAMPLEAKSCAPETRKTCPENLCMSLPWGSGLVVGVPVAAITRPKSLDHHVLAGRHALVSRKER